jgi:hypothetical protein
MSGVLKSRHFMTMRLKATRQQLGATQYGDRSIAVVTFAELKGEGIQATLLPGGSDWLSATADGVLRLDCRMAFETADGALIAMTYRGMRHGPAELMQRQVVGEEIDPDLIYHRVAIFFETSADDYQYLNELIAVGKGRLGPDGATYEIFEVL